MPRIARRVGGFGTIGDHGNDDDLEGPLSSGPWVVPGADSEGRRHGGALAKPHNFGLTFEPGRRFSLAGMEGLRVSQLASLSGVPATTLRFYEQKGLLPAERTRSGYRVYGPTAVDRLAFISTGKHLGLPLAEIGELLGVWEHGACRDVRASIRPRLLSRIADAQTRRSELVAFEELLSAAIAHLDALPSKGAPCDARCSFLATFDQRSSARAGAGEVPLPVARSLNGAQQAARFEQWRQLLAGTEPVASADGYSVVLPREAAEAAMKLVSAEQECCPFFSFSLHLGTAGLRLDASAPPEAGELLGQLFKP